MGTLIRWLMVPWAVVVVLGTRTLFPTSSTIAEPRLYEGSYLNVEARNGELLNLKNEVQATMRAETSYKLIHLNSSQTALDVDSVGGMTSYSATLGAGSWLLVAAGGLPVNFYMFGPPGNELRVISHYQSSNGLGIPWIYVLGVLAWLIGSVLLCGFAEDLDVRTLNKSSSSSQP